MVSESGDFVKTLARDLNLQPQASTLPLHCASYPVATTGAKKEELPIREPLTFIIDLLGWELTSHTQCSAVK